MDGHLSQPVGVGSWIERRARIAPSDVAIIHGSKVVTYAELAARIRRLANGLRALGVEQGDRLAWLGANHPAFLEAFFAAGLLGCALAPVNHRVAPAVISDILADSEPRVLLHRQLPDGVELPGSVRQRVGVEATDAGAQPYEELVARSSEDPLATEVDFDAVLLLPHTSGTVGRPKGVMLTHANVTWNVVNMLSVADIRQGDVTIAIAPFFRVGGTGVNVLPVLFLGGTVIVTDELDPGEMLGHIERHRVTVGFGNPDSLAAMTADDRWRSADLTSLRFIITGGAPVPEGLIRTHLERGITLLQGYGLSEAAPAVLLLDPARALHKVGSAGRPPMLVETRITDADGRVLGAGQTGELRVRGPNVMAGYWRDPEATRRVLTPDGWLRTGDAARADEEGDIWIVDRLADGFPTTGGMVFPGDIERVLLEHPAVADAGVVGIESPGGDQTGRAFVVLAPGRSADVEDLLAFARTRLAAHAVPTAIHVVATLPRSSVGKLERHRLREMSEQP